MGSVEVLFTAILIAGTFLVGFMFGVDEGRVHVASGKYECQYIEYTDKWVCGRVK